jgi:hypothetical protein
MSVNNQQLRLHAEAEDWTVLTPLWSGQAARLGVPCQPVRSRRGWLARRWTNSLVVARKNQRSGAGCLRPLSWRDSGCFQHVDERLHQQCDRDQPWR